MDRLKAGDKVFILDTSTYAEEGYAPICTVLRIDESDIPYLSLTACGAEIWGDDTDFAPIYIIPANVKELPTKRKIVIRKCVNLK